MTIQELREMIQSWKDDLDSGSYPEKAEKLPRKKEFNAFIDGMEFIIEAVLSSLKDKQEYFPITRLHRDDLIEKAKETGMLTKKLEKKINEIKDWEMEEYASDLADGFLETNLYWDIISNILDELKKKK